MNDDQYHTLLSSIHKVDKEVSHVRTVVDGLKENHVKLEIRVDGHEAKITSLKETESQAKGGWKAMAVLAGAMYGVFELVKSVFMTKGHP